MKGVQIGQSLGVPLERYFPHFALENPFHTSYFDCVERLEENS